MPGRIRRRFSSDRRAARECRLGVPSKPPPRYAAIRRGMRRFRGHGVTVRVAAADLTWPTGLLNTARNLYPFCVSFAVRWSEVEFAPT